ncbi:WecB/TagA/CpsF family glycosyltransferase [Enterovirga rhinocerotis]|nr:WecB/TagA/CpsF family glycosyltransferase [Enterovirga rhinocerotis]
MSNAAGSVDLFGLAFSNGSGADVLKAARASTAPGPRIIVTANVEHIVTLRDESAFRSAYAHAAVRTLDGMPLVWLARLRGHRDARRVTGHDLLDAVFAEGAAASGRVYMLCASDEAGRILTRRFVAAGYPAAAVAFEVPPFGFERDEAYGRRLAAAIKEHGTTLLLMGVGAPKSEIWADRQGAALGEPVVLCIGEALNVAAGLVPRAPVLMQRLGLEWLFRFAGQPARLFHRYFVRSWRFLVLAGLDRDLGPSLGKRSGA